MTFGCIWRTVARLIYLVNHKLASPFQADDNREPNQRADSAGASALEGQLQPGDMVGEYEIISLLGVGGMGYVYKVRHNALQKFYALKTLSPDKMTENSWYRLQQEAQAIARMNHPNVIAIHNLGMHLNILPFYVMDLLEGENLADVIERTGPLSLEAALPILIGVSKGLGYAHKKGIVHRDIKPGNIFLLNAPDAVGSRVKLVDFGVAKLSGGTADMQNLTAAGEIFGSPYYMSPEQCLGKRVDGRSDIYSLACTFFEILTGGPPFRGGNPIQTMMMHQTQEPPTLTQVTGGEYFPDEIEAMIAVMLEKAPMDRYQNLDEVISELCVIEEEKNFQQSAAGSGSRFKHDLDAAGEAQPRNVAMLVMKICFSLIIIFSVSGTIMYLVNNNFQVPSGEDENQSVSTNNSTSNSTVSKTANSSASSNATSSTANATSSSADDTSATNTGAAANLAVATATPATATNAKATTVAPSGPYFSGVEEHGDVKYKVFDFPNNRSFGTLRFINYDDKQEAQGRQLVRADAEVVLRCNNEMILNPSLLDGFGPADLTEVECVDLFRVGNEFMQHVGRLAGLKCIRIETGEIDDSCLKYIDQLNELKALHLSQTKVLGSGLAKLVRIPKLKRVTFASGLKTPALLAALANSSSLTELNVENSPLNLQDFKTIATMTQLKHLKLNSTGLTNGGLAVISTLPHLKILDARFNLIDAHCLPACKNMKALRQLQLSGENWRDWDTVAFASALQPVSVR